MSIVRLLPLLLLMLACAKRLEPGMVPAEVIHPITDDGWTLTVRHYAGPGEPVLLVHGMGANHFNWDFRPEVSPVDELVEAGFDVWVTGLRGDPDSTAPSRRARSRIQFDDHALHDLPAVIDAVLADADHDQVLWVGHSMGGMLLYTALATQPERVRAGVAIASPADFSHPLRNHTAFRRWGFLVAARRGKVRVGGLARLFSGYKPLIRQVGDPEYLDRGIVRGMAHHALVDLPRPTARQARGWLRARSFTRVTGEPWLDGVQTDVPLLVMGAPADRIASEADVATACRLSTDCVYHRLGVEDGFSHDHGHVDPVVGTTAEQEITPLILDFLQRHRVQTGELPSTNRRAESDQIGMQDPVVVPAGDVPPDDAPGGQ